MSGRPKNMTTEEGKALVMHLALLDDRLPSCLRLGAKGLFYKDGVGGHSRPLIARNGQMLRFVAPFDGVHRLRKGTILHRRLIDFYGRVYPDYLHHDSKGDPTALNSHHPWAYPWLQGYSTGLSRISVRVVDWQRVEFRANTSTIDADTLGRKRSLIALFLALCLDAWDTIPSRGDGQASENPKEGQHP